MSQRQASLCSVPPMMANETIRVCPASWDWMARFYSQKSKLPVSTGVASYAWNIFASVPSSETASDHFSCHPRRRPVVVTEFLVWFLLYSLMVFTEVDRSNGTGEERRLQILWTSIFVRAFSPLWTSREGIRKFRIMGNHHPFCTHSDSQQRLQLLLVAFLKSYLYYYRILLAWGNDFDCRSRLYR